MLKSALDAQRSGHPQGNILDGVALPPSLSRRSTAVTRAPSLRDLRTAAKIKAVAEAPLQSAPPAQITNADKLADQDLDLEKDPQFTRSNGAEESSHLSAHQKVRQVLRGDISTVMEWRASKGYGLSNVSLGI